MSVIRANRFPSGDNAPPPTSLFTLIDPTFCRVVMRAVVDNGKRYNPTAPLLRNLVTMYPNPLLIKNVSAFFGPSGNLIRHAWTTRTVPEPRGLGSVTR